MKPAQYRKFFEQTEERIRKAVNGSSVEEAQRRLLEELISEPTSYTNVQLKELLQLVFRL